MLVYVVAAAAVVVVSVIFAFSSLLFCFASSRVLRDVTLSQQYELLPLCECNRDGADGGGRHLRSGTGAVHGAGGSWWGVFGRWGYENGVYHPSGRLGHTVRHVFEK